MSPFIFILCLESLTGLINQACLEKTWTPFWVGRDKVLISHLMLFADDLLNFGRVYETTSFTLRKILNTFCDARGEQFMKARVG